MTDTAAILRDFAWREAQGHSRLYERLALAAAERPAVHALLDAAPAEQRRATLLFAAIHLLCLRGEGPFPEDGPTLEDFTTRHRDRLIGLLETHRTQTNEPARSAQLLPGVSLAAAGRPIALLEIGASAGLNLLLDRYGYVLDGQEVGPRSSPVMLRPDVTGGPLPVLSMPRIIARAGLDIAPIDVADPDQRDWLRACVWADQPERRARLDRAVALAVDQPPSLVAGDAREDVGRVAAGLPADVPLVVMHSNTLAYLDPDGRRAVRDQIEALASVREVAWVSAEGPGVLPGVFDEPEPKRPSGAWGLLGLAIWRDGRIESRTLGRVGPHGTWLEWI